MEVLSLKNVWLEDKADLGFEIVYLAHLKHLGINVPEGVAVYPPKRLLNDLLKQYSDDELFSHSRERLKKDWLKQATPDNLIKISQSITSISKSEIKNLWTLMLEGWFEQLTRAVVMKKTIEKAGWLGGYALFCGEGQKSGWMEVTGVLGNKILATTGQLDDEDHTRLELIGKEVNKAIPVAVKLWWRKGQNMEVIRVSEIFFDQIGGVEVVSVGEKVTLESNFSAMLATKVILEGEIGSDQMGDGIFSYLESVASIDSESAKLSAFEMVNDRAQVIYRLGRRGEGALEWLQNIDRVEKDLHLMAELEDLSGGSVQICLPYCRSMVEYKTVREVLSRLDYPLSKMFWLEVATPENILNIESYLELGVRGVVINIDKLAHLLQGLDNEVSKVVVPAQTEVLDSVVGIGVKKLHRTNCRVLILGERIYDQELLNLGVKWGVWGVVTKRINLESVTEMLVKSETAVFKSLGAIG